MTSQDDLALLKRMYQRGEITDEQYDVLRRHVLWGTPLPQLVDEVPAPRPAPAPAPAAPRAAGPGGYVPGAGTVGPARYPERGDARYPSGPPEPALPDPGRYAGEAGGGRYPVGAADPSAARPPDGRRYASRRERREAEEAGAAAYSPSSYLPPAGGFLPPTAPRRSRHRRDDPDDDTPDPAAPIPDGSTAYPRRAVQPTAPAAHEAYEAAPRRPGGTDAGGEPVHRHAHRAGRPAAPETDDLAERRSRRPAADSDPDEAEAGRERRDRDRDKNREKDRRAGDRARRRPRRRSVVAVLASVVLALALVAAGVYWFVLRTEGVPPATYARETCGSVHDWQQAVDSSNATLVKAISRQANRSTVRTDVVAYYATVAARTDELRTAVLARGPADVTGGRAYADSLAAAIGDQATALRTLADRARRLDPAAAAFPADLQSVLSGADTAVSAVSAALARPAAGITTELRTALSNEPSCAPYVG